MGSIPHHIMPLVINSLGHTHTHAHTYRHPHRNNFKKPGAWFRKGNGIEIVIIDIKLNKLL